MVLWFSALFRQKKKAQYVVSVRPGWRTFAPWHWGDRKPAIRNLSRLIKFYGKRENLNVLCQTTSIAQAYRESYWSSLATEPPWNAFGIYFQSDFMLCLHIWIFLHQAPNNQMKDIWVIWVCCEESIQAEPSIVEPSWRKPRWGFIVDVKWAFGDKAVKANGDSCLEIISILLTV